MKPLRILVVEDDVMIGPLLAEMLEDLGQSSAPSRSMRSTQWRPPHDVTPI